MLKILHTSDIHLEAKLKFLGEKADEHRRQILLTFREIVSKAISDKYNIVLIAGDLFDTTFPSESIKSEVIEHFRVLAENQIYTAVIAGNHDYLAQGSVYLDKRFRQISSRFVHIFDDLGEVKWEISSLDTTIIGVSLDKQKDSVSPLLKIKEKNSTKYNIGLFHGSLDIGTETTNNPLTKEKLMKLNFDYIALGDWHSYLEVSSNPPIYYSGSPELVQIEQRGSGNILKVELDDSVTVTPINIGKKQALSLDLDISKVSDITEFRAKWRQLAIDNPQDKFIKLSLVGTKNLKVKFSKEDIINFLSERVYYLKLHDISKLELNEDELEKFPEEFLIGKYIRLLQKKKGEDYSQNKIIDDAIQLGVQKLSE